MQFSPGAFDKFLSGPVGQRFAWRKRSACPCASAGSGAAKFNCLVCSGKGHIWAEEVEGFAGMTNQSPQRAMAMFSSFLKGDCTLTIPGSSPLYEAGQWDRFRALDSTSRFSEVVVPGRNDKLLGQVVLIDRVLWLSDDESAIVDGGMPVVAADGSLSWASGGPPAGRTFTIEGERFDEFMCAFPLASDRNVGVSGLPRKLAARMFDILGR